MYARDSLTMFAVSVCAALTTVGARAECPTLEFEEFSSGTTITSQYVGVTFSAPDTFGSCDGDVRVWNMGTYGGTSSGTRGLRTFAGPGCEFSPEHFRMVFDEPQGEVTFTVGPYCGDYVIRAYNAVSGGGLVHSQVVAITDCLSLHGVYRFVRVPSPAENIRRIEIDAGMGASESIDDLRFDLDDTPPIIEIETPMARECVCDSVPIFGSVDDPDGLYIGDKLEIRGQDEVGWTFHNDATGPWSGLLYTWNASSVPGGYYYLRVTGENRCQLSASDTTFVYVDKLPPVLEVRTPAPNAVVGGTVCFDGSAYESRGTRGGCFESYTVRYDAGGSLLPVEPGTPVYTSPVVNDPFAHWDTRDGIPDGSYPVETRAVDICGNEITDVRNVVVDNTSPDAIITQPQDCLYVEEAVAVFGTALDQHLRNWVLEFTGDGEHNWQTIASSDEPRVNDLLAIWDVTELPTCAYTLRLRVWDESVIDCNNSIRNRTDYMVTVNVGVCENFDSDNDGDIDLHDFGAFQDAFTGGGE